MTNAALTELVEPRTSPDKPPEIGDYVGPEMGRAEFLDRGKVYRGDLCDWLSEHNHLRRSLSVIHRFTRAHDQLIAAVHARVVHQWEGGGHGHPPRICVVALGGFGRRELVLHSDVDLMVLMEKATGETERFVRVMMLDLIDLRLDLGHVARTPADCVAKIGSDLESATAMTESHYIAGSRTLFNHYFDAYKAAMRGGGRRWFLRAIYGQNQERRKKYESTVFLLEPDLKDGIGGLRDVHGVQWTLFAHGGSTDLRQLLEYADFKEDDLRHYRDAIAMVHVVRNELHILAGAQNDQLIFDLQPGVAERLGYEPRQHRSAAEVFMGAYYRHARVVERMSQRAIGALARRERSMLGGLVGTLHRRKLDPHLTVQDNILFVNDGQTDYFKQDPRRIMGLFERAVRGGYRIGHRTLDRLTRISHKLGPAFRLEPANGESFKRLLRGPWNVANILADMHECGILGKLIPEFERLRHMVRIDYYHHYTVDEHSLRAMMMAEDLLRHGPSNRPLEARIASEIMRWNLLNLALLLHDVGKGYGSGHALRGGQLAQRIGDRLGMPREDIETVRFLVLSHLKLTHASQRRDFSDPAVADALAREIRSLERLKMLYVHTVCDLKAVSPDAWNDWKGQLLAECYQRTAAILSGTHPDSIRPKPDLELLKREVLRALADQARRNRTKWRLDQAFEEDLDVFLQNLTERYIQHTAPAAIAHHFELRRALTPENLVAWELQPYRGAGYCELDICAIDLPGLFSSICGALMAKGINIWGAHIFSTSDGYAINQIQVTDLENKPLPAGLRIERLRQDLNQVLKGEKTIDQLIEKHQARRPRRLKAKAPYPTSVHFDNTSSQLHTLLEFRSSDRPGLLFDITRAIRQCGLDIHRANINTEAYGVVDVFNVTDLEYNKIHDSTARKKIEQTITEAIDGSH